MRHGTGGEFPPNSGKRWMGIQFNNTDVLVNVYAGKHDKRAIRLYGGRHKRMLPGLNAVVDILTRVLEEGSYKGVAVQSKWSLKKKLEVAEKQIETYNREVTQEDENRGLKELGIVEKSIRKRKRNSTSRSMSRSRSTSRPSKKRVLDYTNGPQSGTLVTDMYTSDEDSSTVSVNNGLFTDVVLDIPPPCTNPKEILNVHDFTSSNFPLPPLSPKPEDGFTSRATSAGSIFDSLYDSDAVLCASRSPSMQPIQMERKRSIGDDGVGGSVSINVYEPPKYSPPSDDVKQEKSWKQWKLDSGFEGKTQTLCNILKGELEAKYEVQPDCGNEMVDVEFEDRLQNDCGFPWNEFIETKIEFDNGDGVDEDIVMDNGVKSEFTEVHDDFNVKHEKFQMEIAEEAKKNCISYLKEGGDPLQRNNPVFLDYCQQMGQIFKQHCNENLSEDKKNRLNVIDMAYSYKPLGHKKTNAQFVEIDVSDFEFFWNHYVEICLGEEPEETLNFNNAGLKLGEDACYYLNWKRLLDPLNNDGFLFLRRVNKRLEWCWNYWIPIEDKHIEGWKIARDMFNLTD